MMTFDLADSTTTSPAFVSAPAPRFLARLDMDLPATPPAAPAPVELTPENDPCGDRAAEPPTMTFDERQAHIIEDREALERAGFTVPEALFAEGTAVIRLGVENARISRLEWEAKPRAEDALRALAATVAAEGRRDIDTTADALILDASDHLHIGQGDGGYRIESGLDGAKRTRTSSAWELIARQADMGNGHAFMADMSGTLRSATFNARRDELKAADPKPIGFKARTRNIGGKPTIYAAASPKYRALDPDTFADTIIQALPPGARADIVYHQGEARGIADIIFHSDLDARNFSCGEVFKAGMRLGWDDCTRGALTADAIFERNLCLNLIVIGLGSLRMAKIIHSGDLASRLAGISKGITESADAIGHFIQKWTAAERTELSPQAGTIRTLPSKLEAKGDKAKAWEDCTQEERLTGIYTGLATAERLPIAIKQIPALVAAHGRDPMASPTTITLASAINAITRHAHEGENMDRWSGDALERAAGLLTWATKPIEFQFAHVRSLAA